MQPSRACNGGGVRARAAAAAVPRGGGAALAGCCRPGWRRQQQPRLLRASSSTSSNASATAAGDSSATDARLAVIVIGASPAGLAAAVGLARRAGCAVDVFDSLQEADALHGPRARHDSLLLGLGPRALRALGSLGVELSTPPLQGAEQQQQQPASSPAAGVQLLQGLVAVGPGGCKRVERFPPPGIAAIDSHSLACQLLAQAAASDGAAPPPQQGPSSTTPLAAPPGTASAASTAEQAQEAAMPAVPHPAAPGAAGHAPQHAPQPDEPASAGAVRCHAGQQLVLVDTLNRQVTFMPAAGGATLVRRYDLLVGADPCGTALVAAATAQLRSREDAHRHAGAGGHKRGLFSSPAAAAASSARGAAGGGASGSGANGGHHGRSASWLAADSSPAQVDVEYKAWQDVHGAPEIQELLPAGDRRAGGWLLIWTCGGGSSSSASASSQLYGVAGGPSCSLMAWPSSSKAGSWSGAVFAPPQVFEVLRSQADYEGLLQGLSAGSSSSSKLPRTWISSIAEQMRTANVERVVAPASAPAPISAPSAGVVLLGPAAGAALGPQLLSPAAALGLEDAAALVDAVVRAGQHGGSLERGLQQYARARQPQVAALQRLLAGLSWLRHPFSPAAAAAAASVRIGSLAWLLGLFGARRAGLALQWRALASLLPLLAKLGGSGRSGSGTQGVATGSSPNDAAVRLQGLAAQLAPCGSSLLVFMHTTAMPPAVLEQQLQLAPLLRAVLWGGVAFVAAKVVQWCMLLVRAWSLSVSAA